jgi:hypothetical protein
MLYYKAQRRRGLLYRKRASSRLIIHFHVREPEKHAAQTIVTSKNSARSRSESGNGATLHLRSARRHICVHVLCIAM